MIEFFKEIWDEIIWFIRNPFILKEQRDRANYIFSDEHQKDLKVIFDSEIREEERRYNKKLIDEAMTKRKANPELVKKEVKALIKTTKEIRKRLYPKKKGMKG